VEVLADTATALESLPSTDTLSTHRSQSALEEGVAPAAHLDRAFEARWHGTPAVVASGAEAHSAEAEVLGKREEQLGEANSALAFR
jgi:hypothetical protein